MDAFTHTAAGLLLARAGLNRWSPLATPIVVLAANAPDLDFVSAAFGPASYLRYRFGPLHSLAAVLPLALAAVLIVWIIGRRRGRAICWFPAVAAACLGVLLHLGLDAVTSAGLALFLPFSPSLVRFDFLASADFLVWAVLGLAIAGPFLAGLVGQEITSGALRQKYPSRTAPVCALLFLGGWIWMRGVCHARALAQLDAWNFGGEATTRLAVLPDAWNPFRWRTLAETRDAYATGDLDLIRDFDPTAGAILHKPEIAPAIEAAASAEPVRLFLSRARFPLWRIAPADEPEGASLVGVDDLATETPGSRAAAAEALVSNRNQVLRVTLRLPWLPGS